jgi:hypothetical protein
VIRAEARAGTGVSEACVRRLGFTFDGLARGIGKKWRLAPELQAIWDDGGSPPQLAGLARFGNELTRLMYKPSTKHEAGRQLLILRYGYTLRLREDDLPWIWEHAQEETRAMFGTMGVMVGSSTSLSFSS